MSLIQPSDYYSNTAQSPLYQPIGEWTGRLILPSLAQRQKSDIVLFEIHNAAPAYQDLIGKIVNLKWSSEPQVQAFVEAVTRDVNFTQATINSQKKGFIHPARLNKLERVGPLESLAGYRPANDVIVMLPNPVVEMVQGLPTLVIEQQPVQITGSIYALVTIIQRQGNSDRFLVRHFNLASKQFDGLEEIIRIPQVNPDRRGIARSTNRNIEKSPLNPTGWYVYGVMTDKIFVTQAIVPRAILQLQPNAVRLGQSAIAYIHEENWQNTISQKGTATTILLDPNVKHNPEVISNWQEGDRAIVMHIFGGIGGKKGEPVILGLVTGHFAYGIARVVREPLSDELQFDIEYRQVYANNPDGIVSGTIHWSNYMGDLQRGWLGNRPVADMIVKLPAVTADYDFDGIQLSPMTEFIRQLDIMTARYRTGDGDGASLVSPSSSCVQDANQALYITIQQMEKEVESSPQIQDWLKSHPDDLQTKRFRQLVELGRSLERNLVPLGIIRTDWRNNRKLAGMGTESNFLVAIWRGFTSWRTMIPRRAQDEIAIILLKHRASMWVLRTNQVGGFNPDILPLAPTALFGRWTR